MYEGMYILHEVVHALMLEDVYVFHEGMYDLVHESMYVLPCTFSWKSWRTCMSSWRSWRLCTSSFLSMCMTLWRLYMVVHNTSIGVMYTFIL